MGGRKGYSNVAGWTPGGTGGGVGAVGASDTLQSKLILSEGGLKRGGESDYARQVREYEGRKKAVELVELDRRSQYGIDTFDIEEGLKPYTSDYMGLYNDAVRAVRGGLKEDFIGEKPTKGGEQAFKTPYDKKGVLPYSKQEDTREKNNYAIPTKDTGKMTNKDFFNYITKEHTSMLEDAMDFTFVSGTGGASFAQRYDNNGKHLYGKGLSNNFKNLKDFAEKYTKEEREYTYVYGLKNGKVYVFVQGERGCCSTGFEGGLRPMQETQTWADVHTHPYTKGEHASFYSVEDIIHYSEGNQTAGILVSPDGVNGKRYIMALSPTKSYIRKGTEGRPDETDQTAVANFFWNHGNNPLDTDRDTYYERVNRTASVRASRLVGRYYSKDWGQVKSKEEATKLNKKMYEATEIIRKSEFQRIHARLMVSWLSKGDWRLRIYDTSGKTYTPKKLFSRDYDVGKVLTSVNPSLKSTYKKPVKSGTDKKTGFKLISPKTGTKMPKNYVKLMKKLIDKGSEGLTEKQQVQLKKYIAKYGIL